MIRTLLSSLVLAASVAGAVLAQDSAPVYCGSFTPFSIRASAAGKTADARASQAMDIINKYLGGKTGNVSVRPDGKQARLLLNGETVAVVTPADAAAERQPNAISVAQKWSRALAKAFNESKAQK
ncbi:MAG TPA: hypothetical protein VFU47_14610 [Armatimonadota bacterium]|nr:hypothetical protein [Armatimonadota bacterium]